MDIDTKNIPDGPLRGRCAVISVIALSFASHIKLFISNKAIPEHPTCGGRTAAHSPLQSPRSLTGSSINGSKQLFINDTDFSPASFA